MTGLYRPPSGDANVLAVPGVTPAGNLCYRCNTCVPAPPRHTPRHVAGEGDFAGGARDWREKADGHPMNRDIDQLIEQLKSRLPDVEVDQLEPTEGGGEEDGLWFFRMPGSGQEIAVETEAGALPFTLEHDDMRSSAEAETAGSVDEAVEKVVAYLSAARPA